MAAGTRAEKPGYSWRDFRADVVAGLTVATVAVPQGMAYALIAGIEPRYGLYTAIVMTALASVFGSSRHLINGPTNAISLVVFGAIDGLSNGPADPHRMEMVALLAVLVGLIQILIAILRLGDLTRYVSESVVLGFMAGAGILVALSQLHGLLGIRPVGTGEDHVLVRLWLTLTRGGPVNFWAVAIGVSTILLVFSLHQVGRLLKTRLPELLITLVVVSSATWLFDLMPEQGAIQRLQIEPQLPTLALPPVTPDRVRQLWGGALAISLLGLVEALAIAKALAARTRQPLDYNRQCLAEGIANLGAGLFRCMPGSGSLTRSTINYVAGAVSRVSGIISAAAVAATLLLFAPLARYIPQPALAGVILWTAWRIVDRQRFLYCLRATRFDAGLALATAAAAVFLSIEFSILIGVFLSFLFFVPRASRLLATEMVVAKERVVRERRPDDPRCDKLVLMSLEGELFFGAAPELDAVLAELGARAAGGARVIVLRLKRVRNPDMVCLERLQQFLEAMQLKCVVVLLCGVREDFAQAVSRLGFHDWLPADRIYREEPAGENGEGRDMTSTLRAVKRAYEILGSDLCAGCPRRQEAEAEKGWYYMI
jgi:sulfate permease, SulP family